VQTANERREEIRNYLSDVRFTTLQNLMDKFHVSKSTIRRDIDILTETTPLETVPGNGGGIRVADGWYSNRRYLTDEQEALLTRLSEGLQPEDLKTMQGILTAFGKPKPRA
jgi:DeoR/GlpR family transcriptional regulator of sugar metabolism